MSNMWTKSNRDGPISRFFYWIHARETVREQKQSGRPAPWINDPILQNYRFCNVVRMEDTVSQWLMKNWYKPYRDHPNMLIACMLARFFNLPEALEAIGFPEEGSWEPADVRKILRARAKRGEKNFNSAYMIRGNEGIDKIACVMNHTIAPTYRNRLKLDTDNMQTAHKQLLKVKGLGSFMAGQIVADYRQAMSGNWYDAKTWAPIGPGSQRGMARYYGDNTAKQKYSQEKFQHQLGLIMRLGEERLWSAITDRMEAMDWQNCLCEFDKYERVRLGQGRPKRRYAGCPV